MTTDTELPIPNDATTVRNYYWPTQPPSTVTAAEAGIARLDELVAAARTRLDDHDRRARQRVTALALAAIAGDDLERHQLTLVDTERPTLAAAEEQLRHARAIASHRLTQARQSDPVYLKWVAECREVDDEWQQANTSEDRTSSMVDFMRRHNPR